jgi:hypothetical protein
MLEAEARGKPQPGLLLPTMRLVVILLDGHWRGMQPGCMMKILEAEQ